MASRRCHGVRISTPPASPPPRSTRTAVSRATRTLPPGIPENFTELRRPELKCSGRKTSAERTEIQGPRAILRKQRGDERMRQLPGRDCALVRGAGGVRSLALSDKAPCGRGYPTRVSPITQFSFPFPLPVFTGTGIGHLVFDMLH